MFIIHVAATLTNKERDVQTPLMLGINPTYILLYNNFHMHS